MLKFEQIDLQQPFLISDQFNFLGRAVLSALIPRFPAVCAVRASVLQPILAKNAANALELLSACTSCRLKSISKIELPIVHNVRGEVWNAVHESMLLRILRETAPA